jgi:hypothetical protein
MELIERYFQAVKFALPQAQRDDIIKELRDNILSQIEEKEADLGHPLGEDEQVELLKKLGSPMHLASRYRKQRHLIGAAMFPIYWKILKAALGFAFLVLVIASIATAAAGKTLMESLGVLFRYPGVALMTFAWITLVFSALEYFGAKFHVSDRWDPRKLPRLTKHNPRKSSFELITQLLLQTIFGVWWLVGLHHQYLILGPGAALIRFGSMWLTIYPLWVTVVTIDAILTGAMLAWPAWSQGRTVSRMVMSAIGLVILYFLISAPELFVAADPGAPQLQALAKGISFGLHLGLVIAAIASVVNLVVGSIRLVGRRFSAVHQATVA